MAHQSAKKKLSITELAVQGLCQRDIAKAVGLTQARVSQILSSDDEIRKQITAGQKAQVVLLPIAVKRHAELLDSPDEKIRLQAVKLTYDTTGIAPSHAPSIFVQQILNQQVNVLDPGTSRLLSEFMASQLKPVNDE